jgi:hypothetical protein
MPNLYETNNQVYQLSDAIDRNGAVSMSDGWYSFADLDNFDSVKLLRALTLKVLFGSILHRFEFARFS